MQNVDRLHEQIFQMEMSQNNIITISALQDAAQAGQANLQVRIAPSNCLFMLSYIKKFADFLWIIVGSDIEKCLSLKKHWPKPLTVCVAASFLLRCVMIVVCSASCGIRTRFCICDLS